MTIDGVALMIKLWADDTFPDRTDTSMYLKLYSEVAEMIEATDDGVEDEIADVLIMLLDFAKRKNVNIGEAITRKMAINRGRVWRLNGSGVFKHVVENEP